MRVAVIGVGLIGGSIALAARERLGAEVTGWDLNPAALAQARSTRRDRLRRRLACRAPSPKRTWCLWPRRSARCRSWSREVLARAPAGCVVSDVGSTKRTMVDACSDPRFVGGHPLAGAETSGVENARADLFDGATWYLTPGAHDGDRDDRRRVGRAGHARSARASAQIDAAAHDRLMATVSHLPHVFANVLVAQLAGRPTIPAVPGPSFRDATRVAGSNTAVWSDIYMDNRDALERCDRRRRSRAWRGARGARGAAISRRLVRWSEQAAADRERLGP